MATPLRIMMLEDSDTDAELVHRLLKKKCRRLSTGW